MLEMWGLLGPFVELRFSWALVAICRASGRWIRLQENHEGKQISKIVFLRFHV